MEYEGKNNNKLRLIYMAKIISERTDEDNMLTGAQITQILEEEYGISSHRQTIAADIELLQEFGMDIETIKSNQNRYHLVSRTFDTAELKLLIDAVASCKFISSKKSKALVEKISTLSGINKAQELQRFVEVEGRIKTDNEKSFIIIDAINEAITLGKKITFKYYRFSETGKKQLTNDGAAYVFSPYRLVWNGDYYYMIGWSDKHANIATFRIDRIDTVPEIIDEKAHKMPKNFSLNKYINTMMHMYSSERTEVSLICDNSVMDAIVDKFGEKLKVTKADDGHFGVKVEVAVNHIFFSWIFGFGGLVKIKGPKKVKDEYKAMLMRAME